KDDVVVGMIAIHNHPPYSIAEKLADATVLDRLGRIAEVRLLAIDPAHRSGMLVQMLFLFVYEAAQSCDAIVISGRVEERAMYYSLGFRALGPAVRSGDAEYEPMAVKLTDLEAQAMRWRRRVSNAERSTRQS